MKYRSLVKYESNWNLVAIKFNIKFISFGIFFFFFVKGEGPDLGYVPEFNNLIDKITKMV